MKRLEFLKKSARVIVGTSFISLPSIVLSKNIVADDWYFECTSEKILRGKKYMFQCNIDYDFYPKVGEIVGLTIKEPDPNDKIFVFRNAYLDYQITSLKTSGIEKWLAYVEVPKSFRWSIDRKLDINSTEFDFIRQIKQVSYKQKKYADFLDRRGKSLIKLDRCIKINRNGGAWGLY